MNSFIKLFTESPKSFQGQEKDEKIVLFIRRHSIVIILKIIGLLMGYAIPLLLSTVFIDFIINHNLLALYFFVISLWTLFLWLAIFYACTMYTLDVWIITDTRIIDSTQHGFFNRTVSELHLSRIQDIYVKTEGPLQTLISFGDLLVQTAGKQERFIFLQIPHPLRVKDAIMSMAFSDEHHKQPAV